MAAITVPIYLDNAATTPLAPSVLAAIQAELEHSYANPASTHTPGRQAAQSVAKARTTVAQLIGANAQEIVWTSGATEANNLAIKGVADFYHRQQRKPGHIITTHTEHKAVVDPVRDLEKQGWRVTWLAVDAKGHINLSALSEAACPDTALISLMHVNNEIGVIHDIPAVAELARQHGITLHVDAAQSLGKLPVDVNTLGVDLLAMSAHKFNGPKGIGALYVRQRPKARLLAQIHGGGHEQNLRSGTLAPHQIAGFAAACDLAGSDRRVQQTQIAHLRDMLWNKLQTLPGIIRNGCTDRSVAGILNVSIPGVDGEALLAAVTGGEDALAVSSGSACSAARAESSYVLRALGRPSELAGASLRLSLGRFNTERDVNVAAEKIIFEVKRLRALSPVWANTPTITLADAV